ncbi:MAG: hypothetical protein NC341_09145 [Blautia sp.]|nr:hypothetical protein [Blautia sp.]MCM1201844.1 hypothetical protein [Bacteroides fragilis]
MADVVKSTNILFIGGASSGKTVAASSTYYKMNADGGVGDDKVKFDLTSIGNAGAANNTELFDNFIRMLKGTFPNGSIDNKYYDFAFRRNAETICEIMWMDYRGANIEENWPDDDSGDSVKKSDIQEFKAMLRHAMILIYIIPGDIVQKYSDLEKLPPQSLERTIGMAEITKEMGQFNFIMEKVKELRKDDYQKIPILFYITKSDELVCDDREKFSKLTAFLKSHRLLKGHEKILGCHSTLGRDLIVEDNTIKAGIVPEGFEIPLMLTVGYFISDEGKEWETRENARIDAEVQLEQGKIARGYQELGGLQSGFVYNVFGPSKKKREQIQKLEKKAAESKAKMLELENDRKKLDNRLKSYSQDILSYIEQCTDDNCKYVIYMNEEGEERPLREFFE